MKGQIEQLSFVDHFKHNELFCCDGFLNCDEDLASDWSLARDCLVARDGVSACNEVIAHDGVLACNEVIGRNGISVAKELGSFASEILSVFCEEFGSDFATHCILVEVRFCCFPWKIWKASLLVLSLQETLRAKTISTSSVT